MSDPSAVIVDHVSKKFARSLKRAMVYGLQDISRAVLLPKRFKSPGLDARIEDQRNTPILLDEPPKISPLRSTEFWALKDVSFQLKPGESIGLIGANGAGKSTLFSILSGIYAPTHGQALIRGKLQALIALGAGFHPALSGRENVYINAAILGMSSKKVDTIMDEIIEFSGVRDFIDAPVKNYSSGMLVRLGFSVAIHLDPDVLLIDEVLAVGDAAFQLKCARFSRNLINSGKTLMIVSHNMLIIQMMADRVLWMNKGEIVEDGETQEVVERYKKFMMMQAEAAGDAEKAEDKNIVSTIYQMYWTDAKGKKVEEPVEQEPHFINMEIECFEPIECARIWIQVGVVDKPGAILGASMFEDGHYVSLKKGMNLVRLHFNRIPLKRGKCYRMMAGIRDWTGHVMLTNSYASEIFDVQGDSVPCLNGIGSAKKVDGTIDVLVSEPYEWRPEGSAMLHSDEGSNLLG